MVDSLESGKKSNTPCIRFVQGVFFMCRKNQLCGCALVAFGFGLLIGTLLESGFFSFCAGVSIMVLGFWCTGKK